METEYTIIFKLNDDGKTCTFRDKKYDIKENENERYIECDEKKYRLIERNEQIQAILENSTEMFDFTYCIFLDKVHFQKYVFSKEVDFSYCIFQKNVYFEESIFQEKANFFNSIFNKKTIFMESIFNKRTIFNLSIFNEKIGFIGSKFNKEVHFYSSKFNKEVNFNSSKIELLDFSNVKTGKNFTVNLKFSQIERFDYEDTDFKNAENSESYLKLKNFALKNNDQKNALNFYKKEMEKYREEVKKKGKISDKFILSFEKFISDYGTNPFKPLVIMLIVSFLFSLIVFIDFTCSIKNMSLILMPCISCLDIISTTILLLNPTSSIKSNIEEDVPLFLEALNFLKNIFFSILIYEAIKSFRKFSRKL